MTIQDKAVGCGDTQAAQQNNCVFNFTQLIVTLKAACFHAADWLSLIGGVLL